MRTRTIYNAMRYADDRITSWAASQRSSPFAPNLWAIKKARQYATFERELLRRIDERDALVATRNMNQLRTFRDESGRFMTITGKWGI